MKYNRELRYIDNAIYITEDGDSSKEELVVNTDFKVNNAKLLVGKYNAKSWRNEFIMVCGEDKCGNSVLCVVNCNKDSMKDRIVEQVATNNTTNSKELIASYFNTECDETVFHVASCGVIMEVRCKGTEASTRVVIDYVDKIDLIKYVDLMILGEKNRKHGKEVEVQFMYKDEDGFMAGKEKTILVKDGNVSVKDRVFK